MPPPDTGPAPPHNAHGIYETGPWRPPYAHAHYDHAPDPRRPPPPPAGPSHVPPPQGYPVIPNRELPQPPLDGPYGRPNSLPAHAHPDPGASAHPGYRPPNGLPHEVSPHSAPPEFRSRMGFAPPEPPGTNESSPTSASIPQTTQYMPSGPSIPASTPVATGTPIPYDSAYPQNPAYGARIRKAARAQQACDQCRARKAKCDEGRPACSHCKENNLICVYKEVPPHKQEKTTQIILDKLMELEDKFMERFSNLDRQGSIHERTLGEFSKGMRSSVPPRDTPLKMEPTTLPTEMLDEKPGSFASQALAKADPTATSFDEQANGQDNEGELSIPVEHTTAAHKLLMWPSIKSLIRDPGYDEDYVMQLEKDRPITSVFGEGESSFSSGFLSWVMARNRMAGNEKLETPGTVLPDDLLPEPEIDDNNWPSLPCTSSTPSWTSQVYGRFLLTTHGGIALAVQCPPMATAAKTLEVRNVSDLMVTCKAPRGAPPAPSLSPFQENDTIKVHESRHSNLNPSDEMNIDNAIILLVFALGAICETPHPLPGPAGPLDYHDQYIPGPSQPKKPKPNGIQAANGVLSPANSDSALPTSSSFYTQMQSTSHSFPARIEPTPPQKPISGGATGTEGSGRPKNYRVIPGLFFFGYATMILGTLQGVGTLKSVQARLLAGLYAGQLAHPFQSHAWISEASRCCQVLIAPKSFDAASEKMRDLITFAFWTCLQLESDLLAELDIPASDDNVHDPVLTMLYYSAQIHLRKVLNRVHTDLYKVEKAGAESRWSSNVQEALSMNLDLWRNSLPDIMNWKDGQEISDDINAARMRAKYFGARYIIHRPLLYHALHFGNAGTRVYPAGQAAVDSPTSSATTSQTQMSPSMPTGGHRASGMARIVSDLGSAPMATTSFPNGWTRPKVKLDDLPSKLRRACVVCVDSAIKSTEAFDGIKDRLVVTNIFGTAHAQFGNMLVLAATYHSELRELVEGPKFKRLLRRTIKFLLRNENISPTFRADAKILTEIFEDTFPGEPLDLS
ncbi:hypothetical protein N7468_005673 [Penicillium chermesinum]|uniref:Zn(2)-C6 fungal-type domain-containing protein n=1 Tax=Penicillium chermesinum TaxID=63820 RepID=A0A9W9TNF3_9EURO|nr:uncharacterized protein N7468_005673 [Penicillium chermesinum]KAJ5232717.1 hypothetical protein N7468_005673 [Penicillium chermesinum]